MKITFVIPSREFLASAGARIRYLRMVPLAQAAGHTVNLVPITEFADMAEPGDAVIFSKCFDARAIVAAARCRADGCAVGVDLFDDYFTQTGDSRMTLYRTWLEQMLASAHFAICSTSRMAEIVAQRSPDLPVHVFNDPASDMREDVLPGLLDEKRERAIADRRIDLCWFGIGDNPFFPVGLEDLVAFGGRFAPLQADGWKIELTVSTNARALDAERLGRLARLPFPTTVELWTEERETELLLQSLCCFLPVNSQPFSIAKSLNRAVSALTAGCQVVWAGYPLYRNFGDLVYEDPARFATDLETRNLRHSSRNFATYRNLMNEFASLEIEVDRMIAFLDKVAVPHMDTGRDPAASERIPVLIHGVQTNGHAHKAARRDNVLSVGTPLSPPTLVYDVLFAGRIAGDDLKMLVSEPTLARLPAAASAAARQFGKINKMTYFAIDWPEDQPMKLHDWSKAHLAETLAAYTGLFDTVAQRLEAVFGPVDVMISESSKLPFDPHAGGRAA